MKIAIIGTGRMGETFARRWRQCGHEITFGSRDPERAATLAAEIAPGVQAAAPASAVASADVVVLAFPWFAATDVFREVGDLSSTVVVDCINPMMSSGKLALGHKTSAAEEIQRWVPRAYVVKAFNHIHWQILADPTFGDVAADAFYCGNDDDAKETVRSLAVDLDFNPVDCGPLRSARLLEPLALLWIQLAFTGNLGVDFAVKLIHR
jgi:NADPH-dependent F420 reductase